MPRSHNIAIPCMLALCSGKLAAQSAPKETRAIFDRGTAALQAGHLPEAEHDFLAVLAAEPANLPAMGNLGVLYARTHRFAEAIAIDQRALAVAPDDAGLLLNIGLAYLKQEDYPRARPYFERLRETGSGGARVVLLLATTLILGDAPQKGLDLLQADSATSTDPSALYLEAVAYARLNQKEAGQRIFTQLLLGSATRAQANFVLGQALHDGHRTEEAAEAFRQTLSQEPAYPGAHRELGKVYISMQQFAEAERELRTAVTQDPQDGSALYFLGALLVQTAHEAQGEPFLERARVLMPDSWAIPLYLGKAKLKANKPAEAVPLLEQAASMNGDEPQVFYLLAGALRTTGHPDEARAAMQRVQALHSSALDAEKQAIARTVAGAR